MSFLLNFNTNFSIIENNSKYGVFCQLYNHTGVSRPIQIQTLNGTDYSAALDNSGNIHATAMPTKYQITYFCYENGHYSKKTLVENTTEAYVFSAPMIHVIQNEVHVFYLSNRTGSNAYAIVHQTLNSPSIETLLETNCTLQNIKSFKYNDSIYIFYMLQHDNYLLNCLKITNNEREEITVLASKVPICDYSVCISENHIDVVYVAELHGKYQLVYYNYEHQIANAICHTIAPSNPVVFWYRSYLWINYLEDNKLYVILSIDGGNSFSSPILSSIQNNTGRYSFTTNKECSLRCTELYASVTNSIRINPIFTIDLDHIHPDSKVSLELELLLEALTLSSKACSHAAELLQENAKLKEELSMLKSKYDHSLPLSVHASQAEEAALSSVKTAANAFMDQLTQWDTPPRL